MVSFSDFISKGCKDADAFGDVHTRADPDDYGVRVYSAPRFMQANLALRKGLGAVVGLNFDTLAPALQVKMMRPMTITRYEKVRVLDFFFV